MDRNTLTGLLIIGGLLIGYSWFTQPSDSELAAAKSQRDSLRALEETEARASLDTVIKAASYVQEAVVTETKDSAWKAEQAMRFGGFSTARDGDLKYSTIENEKMIVTLSNKGGRMVSVELKDYKTFEQKSLMLFDEDSSRFNLNFLYEGNYLSTSDFFFEPSDVDVSVQGKDRLVFTYRLYAGSSSKYIEYRYALDGDAYVLDYSVSMVGLADKREVPLFPRWACYVTIWCGLSFLPASLTGVLKTGPFAWDGMLSYYIPYACWLGWYTIASTYMIKEVKRRQKASEATPEYNPSLSKA